jgi:hypothetical protein
LAREILQKLRERIHYRDGAWPGQEEGTDKRIEEFRD